MRTQWPVSRSAFALAAMLAQPIADQFAAVVADAARWACCEDVAEGQEEAGRHEKAEGWQCVAAEAK